MKKECIRCGNCCQTDFFAYTTAEEIERWRNENRTDVLKIVNGDNRIWAGDQIINSSGEPVVPCSCALVEKNIYTCSIYETRPFVCRNFMPGVSPLCPLYGK
jgi:Fe-S-cluster containining protein